MEQDKRKVMVIMAHPDDPEFFCGGTVARWVREGTEVTYLILTNGNKGSDDPNATPGELTLLREREQRAAAQLLGVHHIVFLGCEDGELQPTLDLRRDIARVVRQHKPEAVIAPDPTVRFYGDSYINHPDHLAAGDAALDGIFPAAGNRLYFPELLAAGLEPHKVKEVYLAASKEADFWVYLEEEDLERKIQAVQAHRSQIGDPAGVAEMIRRWAEQEAPGNPSRYAESFKRIVPG